jgi:N-acyl-D-aspartate/D-glutamate deacylase
MTDVTIRGGLIVDGTGHPGFEGDIAITDGVITEVGCNLGRSAVDIDATGAIVTPGFVDPHTHLDAQLFWDPAGTPSVYHGITTVMIGMCGFGVAPCHEKDRDYLLRTLELVEEIPYSVSSAGMTFAWSTFSEYMDALDSLRLGVNVGTLVPHSPLRAFAYADPRTRDPSAEELAHLIHLYGDALSSGAFGFSTSRGPNHHDVDGQPVPSRFASDEELRLLVEQSRGCVWQINTKSKGSSGAGPLIEEVTEYARWTKDADSRLTWTPFLVPAGDTERWREVLAFTRRLDPSGSQIVPQVLAQEIVMGMRFDGSSYAAHVDGWEQPMAAFLRLDLPDQLVRLDDEDFRGRLRAVPENCRQMLSPCYERWRLVESKAHPEWQGRSLADIGRLLGTHPVDVMCDIARDDRLTSQFAVSISNFDVEAVAELVASEHSLVGLGDAGAHAQSVCNYSYPTYLLSKLVRDDGIISLESAVRELTARPASVFGIANVGELTPGKRADLNVLDLARLELCPPQTVFDMPRQGRRLLQKASGYRNVLVNGTMVLADGVLTGALPGRLLRKGRG